MHDLLGTAVKFRTAKNEVVDAIVIGFDHPQEDSPVKLHLVYAHPEKLHSLGGTQWAQSFETAYSVPLLDESEDPLTCDLSPDISMLHSREVAIASLRQLLREAQKDVELLKAELRETTEGKDKELQAMADAGARKRVVGYESTYGVAPCGEPTAADLDAHASEQQAAEATAGPTE